MKILDMKSKIIEEIYSIIAEKVKGDIEDKVIDFREEKFIEDVLQDVDERIKESVENEEVRDWILKNYDQLEKNTHFFSKEEQKNIVETFFLDHKKPEHLYSNTVKKIILQYTDNINECVNNILSMEAKVILSTIKKEQELQTNKIIGNIENICREALSGNQEEMIQTEEKNKKIEDIKCPGYGIYKNRCENKILAKNRMCIRCQCLKYYEQIENLYRVQHYSITKEKKWFSAEEKSGIIRAKAMVVPFYSEKENIVYEDIRYSLEQIQKNIDKYQYVHIISNTEFDENIRNQILMCDRNEKIRILSEEEVRDAIIDFSSYLRSNIKEYEKSPIFKHYIDLYDKNEEILLEKTIYDFLESNDENAFLILGDYGCGKTSFLLNLLYELSQQYFDKKSEYIPIFIQLRDYTKDINLDNLFLNFFIKKCQASNLSIEAFKMLLQYRKFVILFDGFDEVAKRVNYDVKFSVFNQICKYCTGETKVIITCRPNYFQEQKEYKDLIENAHLEFEPDRGFKNVWFRETYIAELLPSQIKEYIKSFEEELEKKGFKVFEIEKLIKNTHDLMDLSKRPFLLNIIVKTLPSLIENSEAKKEKLTINAAILYEKYTGIWLDRENSKGKTLIRKEDKLHFCIYIAYKMFNENILSIHFKQFPDEIKEYFKDLSKIDEIDYFSHDIQSCSFMNSDGQGNFKFIHKSFMEYFVACYITERLQRFIEGKINIEAVLSVKDISSEVALFINDILEQDQTLHKKVISKLKESIDSQNENIKKNTITILSNMKYNMKNIIENNKSYDRNDFSRCVIENAVIQNVSFTGAIFYAAELRNVTFQGCDFNFASFQKATLEKVSFSGQYLNNSDFSYAQIEKCDFSKTFFEEAKISKATITETDFKECNMSAIESIDTVYRNNRNLQDVMGIPYDME